MPTTFDADTSLRTLYTASVLSPVEIRLHSTVPYENPFVATEIDATFTHTDGTTVSIPGFWREGETWAVRFTPTKEGEWRYRVTCKDPTNQGLFAEGTVEAAPSQGKTELTRRGFRLYSMSFLLAGFSIFGSSFFTALGNGLVSATISFLRSMLFQVAAVLTLPILLGIDGIWLAVSAAELASLAVSAAFLIGLRKRYHYM